ncbi:hypothetical protein [Deinococcus hopiensis]|uniref:Uncharacterized protein n=1 Tax=Deinococcus hopiensis KR-140 TaxID=695939 RepID=A0A1W1V7P7_9DEIO|nr:hypothetical protein [Deinococcus hopiensis]SMB89355.1 hypothetical protein SAMN00790413_00377 [Deinococcus hopiensis KR-140]
MSREERLQQVLKTFVDTLNDFAEGRHSPEVHAATIRRLLAEVHALKAAGAGPQAISTVSFVA